MTQQEWMAIMGANPSANQQSPNLPVEQISWDDAQAMLQKLNAKIPGGGFRLPTEAEWEYAAGNSVEGAYFARRQTRPAGEGKPNKFGLYNMQGNVWEWCSTLFKPYPYVADDGRESQSEAGMRILKGGGFQDTEEVLDPALRHAERSNRKFRYNGVRLVRSAM
jgi:formylglycine-generating enzyme required for sulfatase activity